MTPAEVAAARKLIIATRVDVPFACSDCCDPARGRTKLAALVPGLLDEVERMRMERDTDGSLSPMDRPRGVWEQRCLDLLARVHRDGGHYVGIHGIDTALADADEIVANLLSRDVKRERDAAMRAGIEQCIDIVGRRQRYYEHYRESGPMQTKPATFAVLDEVMTFLNAHLERKGPT